jgi:ankyrin repeat protein
VAESARPALAAPSASQRLLSAAATGTPDLVRQALQDGAPVNAADAAGRTALMLAGRRGDEPMVRLLLAAGSDRSKTDSAGLTAAEHARRAGHATLAALVDTTESTVPAPVR